MHSEASIEAQSLTVVASGATRSLCLDAFSLGVLAICLAFIAPYSDWALPLGATLLVWLALFWLLDRLRLGAEHRKVRKAQRAYIRSLGPIPFLTGFGSMFAAMFLLGIHDNIGVVLSASFSAGALSQALWISYTLRRQH